MAHNKNTKKSEGFCRKIYNAISPFRSRISRVSHQPHSSIPVATAQNPKSDVLDQPSLWKMVPIEHQPAQRNKKVASKRGQDFGEREILIVNGQKPKVASNKDKPKVASFGKAKSNKEDDSMHENRFNDYIDKVRKRLLKTTSSHVGDI